MTEDFKIIAKDYVAKSLQYGSQGSRELFYGQYTGIARIYDDFDENAIIKCVKQVVSPKNVGVMWTILVLWSDTLLKGRFVILDENNEVISTIDEYTSGVNIGCYYCIDLDDKGRLYGVEWFNQERVRFIMLNNVSVPRGEEFYADIRKTYDIPTLNSHAPLQNKNCVGYMVKSTDVAKYGFFIRNANAEGNFYTFEIDVENGNTWKEQIVSNGIFQFKDPLITYDSNSMFNMKILIMDSTVDTSIIKCICQEGQDNITLTTNTIMTTSNSKSIVNECDIWWIDNSTILVPFIDDNYNKLYLQKLNIDTETTFTQVYEEDFYTNQIQVKFSKANNYCYMFVVGKNYNAPGTPEDERLAQEGFKVSVYHIFTPAFTYSPPSSNLFEEVIQETNNHNLIPDWFGVEYYIVQNQYNLYNHIYSINLYDNSSKILNVSASQEIYNENNYNGSPYIPYLDSALKPQQFILKNQDKILYARDIYNKTAYGNIVDTTLQIPNNLVNNIEIDNEQLWSATKIVMNNENKTIIKNKYEELIINIRNRLNLIDNNNGEYILLEEQSTKLHQSLTGIISTVYVGLCIWYAKITYHDNTTENIHTQQNRTDEKTTIYFEITPSKQVDKIEFISQNNTSYISFEPTLEIGKTYTISQDVRIGD